MDYIIGKSQFLRNIISLKSVVASTKLNADKEANLYIPQPQNCFEPFPSKVFKISGINVQKFSIYIHIFCVIYVLCIRQTNSKKSTIDMYGKSMKTNSTPFYKSNFRFTNYGGLENTIIKRRISKIRFSMYQRF